MLTKDELLGWIDRTLKGWETTEMSHTTKLSNPNMVKALQKDVQYLKQIRQIIQNQPEVNGKFFEEWIDKLRIKD